MFACPCKKSNLGGTSAAVLPPTPAVLAYLYDLDNFKGPAVELKKEGIYNFCATPKTLAKNDTIKSVKVAPGYVVTLIMHCGKEPQNFTETLKEDTAKVPGKLYSQASQVKVERDPKVIAILYDGDNYTGAGKVVTAPGHFNFCAKPKPTLQRNDTIKSVWVKPGFEVTLIKHCAGEKPNPELKLTCSTPKIVGELYKQASQVTVAPIPIAILYDEPNFKGPSKVITNLGLYNYCANPKTLQKNDTIRSVKVTPGYKVTLVKHCAGETPNPTLTLTHDTANIEGELDKTASQVKVETSRVLATLFDGENFTGKAIKDITEEGLYAWAGCHSNDTKKTLEKNDTIKSVRVKPGYKVTLIKHCGKIGDLKQNPEEYVVCDTPKLGPVLSGQASQVRVTKA